MRKIVFLGNCQARRLQEFYQQNFSEIYGDATETLVSYHSFTEKTHHSLQSADIIVAQHFDTEQITSVSRVDTAADIIRWPSVAGAFLWPYSGVEHIYNKSLPYYGDGPYGLQFGDRWLNKKISDRLPPDEIVKQYMNLDVAKLAKLDRVYEISMARAIERDHQTGFDTASIIASSLTDTPLFLTPANLELPLFVALARGVYQQLGITLATIDRILRLQWRTVFPSQQQPIHPSIIEHFKLKYIDLQTRYRMSTGERLTYEEWCNRYVRFEWNDPLLRAVLQVEPPAASGSSLDEKIKYTSHALANSNGSDSGYSILGYLLTQKGDHHRALEAKLKTEEFNPNNPDIVVDLCHSLADAGDFEASEQKLNLIAQAWPRYAEVHFRLACFYDRVGRQDEVHGALRRALDRDPTNDHYLQFYGHIIRRFEFSHAMLQPFVIAMNIRPHSIKLKELAIENMLYWNQWQRALVVLDEALRLQPDHEVLRAKRQDTIVNLSQDVRASDVENLTPNFHSTVVEASAVAVE